MIFTFNLVRTKRSSGLRRILTGARGAERLSRDELGTVDELGEVSPRGTHDGRGGDGPALRVGFTANLVVHQLHLFAALQSLESRIY